MLLFFEPNLDIDSKLQQLELKTLTVDKLRADLKPTFESADLKQPFFWFNRSSKLALNDYGISSAQFFALVASKQDGNLEYHPSEDEIRMRLIKNPGLLKEFAKTNPYLSSAFDLLQPHIPAIVHNRGFS